MTYKEDMLGALFVIAALVGEPTVELSSGYYLVGFEGTTATVMLDANLVTLKDIEDTIREAKA